MEFDLCKARSPLPSPKQKQLVWFESLKQGTDTRQASPHPWKETEIFPWNVPQSRICADPADTRNVWDGTGWGKLVH